jgi:hypothetical protein
MDHEGKVWYTQVVAALKIRRNRCGVVAEMPWRYLNQQNPPNPIITDPYTYTCAHLSRSL